MTTLGIHEIDAWKARFQQDGYLILKDFFSRQVIDRVREQVKGIVDDEAAKLLAEGKIVDALDRESFERRLARLYADTPADAPSHYTGEVLHREAFYDLFFDAGLLDLMEQFLGPEVRFYPDYMLRPKLPDNPRMQVLWHQDAGYWHNFKLGDVETLRVISCWTPLVPVGVANGCMQFIPGSHKLGLVPHEKRQFFYEIAADRLNPLLDAGQAISVEVEPGDLVVFSHLLFHCGLPNKSDTIRWSIDWRYQDARQPTMVGQQGYVARSRQNPQQEVNSAGKWASLGAA